MITRLRLVEGAKPLAESDAALVARVRGGDRDAEDALYRAHAESTAGLIARLLGSSQDAEDVLHDAFVIAFLQIDRLREPSAFRGWLRQIAIIRVRRTIRRKRLLRALGLLPAGDDLALERLASPAASPEVLAELAVIDGVLRTLSADQRIAWMLRYVEGHRLVDVAALIGCSLATAKRRIAAAAEAMSAVTDIAPLEEGR